MKKRKKYEVAINLDDLVATEDALTPEWKYTARIVLLRPIDQFMCVARVMLGDALIGTIHTVDDEHFEFITTDYEAMVHRSLMFRYDNTLPTIRMKYKRKGDNETP